MERLVSFGATKRRPMIEKQFFFLAGLPRTGSTVLASILNQNPKIYVTPTSPLETLLRKNDNAWHETPSVIANLFPEQLKNISDAIINGCWEHIDKPIIIDKHRVWSSKIPQIKLGFGQAKIIVTTRDIPSILASFIRIDRNLPVGIGGIDQGLIKEGMWLNDINRTNIMWNTYIKKTWLSFKTGYENDLDCLHIVEYDDLCSKKEEVIKGIYNFLELPYYKHDLENIVNVTPENDEESYGLVGLHNINATLEKTSSDPKDILGESLYNKYKNMNLEFWRS